MTEELGWAAMPIIPDLKKFGSQVRSGTSKAITAESHLAGATFGSNFGTKASSAIHDKFKETAKYIIGPLVGAFAVEKVGDLVKESIDAASSLAASRSRAQVIFGREAEQADQFGERAAKSLGLSHGAALQAETGFGILGQRMGLTDKQNVQFSEHFTKVANDLAAFNHSDPDQAFLALQRGVSGSARGLKPYGVLLDATSIKAEALADGILKPVKNQSAIHAAQVRVLSDQQAYTAALTAHGKQSIEAQKASASLGLAQQSLNTATAGAVPPLTQQQKMLASVKLIQQQTTQQQGAFADSTHHLYGQQRELTASWDNAKDRLGKGLMPTMTDLVHEINQHVIPAVDDASKWFEHKGGPAIHGFEDQLKPLVSSALPALGTGLKDAYKFGKDLLPVATGIFKGFNSLPGWAQKTVLIGGAAGYIGKKSGLLGAAKNALTGGGVAGTIISKAEPVPVFVVNEGFGVPGTGGGGGVPPILKTGGEAAAGDATIAAAAGKSGILAKLLGGLAGDGALAGVARFAGYGLESPAFLALDNEHGNEHAITLTPQDFARNFAGSKTLPKGFDAGFAKTYGITGGANQAKALLNIPELKSTTTGFDALRAHAQNASRTIDQIGPHAEQAFGVSDKAVDAFRQRLDAIQSKKLAIILQDQSAVQGLERLQAFRLKNKTINVFERSQLLDQAVGPGGGQGRHNPGGSGSGRGLGSPDHQQHHHGAGRAPQVHVHLEHLTVHQDGRVSAIVRTESDEDGRYHRQRIEAGSGAH